MKAVAERMQAPRTLYTDFPLGLSLGKPRDQAFQSNVLLAAFELLEESNGPVVKEFPVSISPADQEPILCPLPPRINTDIHAAIDEARYLRSAYDRAQKKNNRTSVGMKISVEHVPEALAKFVRILEGESWDEVGFSSSSIYGTVQDIRSYYEEVACELAEAPIAPWATEEWFYDKTEAGQLILSARRNMRDRKVDQSIWFGLAPAGRE